MARDFYGFWMLGGMAGGGMGFIFDPAIRAEAQGWLQAMMLEVKRSMEASVPFAMDPVVYDFAINDNGTFAELRHDGSLPKGYHALMVPDWLRRGLQQLTPMLRSELERVGNACRDSVGGDNLAVETDSAHSAVHFERGSAVSDVWKICCVKTASTRSPTNNSAKTCDPAASECHRIDCRPLSP